MHCGQLGRSGGMCQYERCVSALSYVLVCELEGPVCDTGMFMVKYWDF